MYRFQLNDALAVAQFTAQAYTINQRVLSERTRTFDFEYLVNTVTEGNPFAPGYVTYTSFETGQADWFNAGAKDVPLADVGQDAMLVSHKMAAIGYQYNLEEINQIFMIAGAQLPERRARAAYTAYRQFMWKLSMFGDKRSNFSGVANSPLVPVRTAIEVNNNTAWIDNDGKVLKTADQIVDDIRLAVFGVHDSTFGIVKATRLMLPQKLYELISTMKMNELGSETVLEYVRRAFRETGRGDDQEYELIVMSELDLATAATTGPMVGGGRMVAYNNDRDFVALHLPMPFRFRDVWQDGPANWQVPGFFRTGGVEWLAPKTAFYVDGISPAPAE